MIEQGLFKKYFVGRDGFYWWIGQIAPEESWRDNKNGIPDANNKNTPGFGERYKVRIMGHHTAVPSELSDDELPWATVMYPVTAGGGTGAASQTSNLRQGMFVFGFFMDGEDGQQPVIMGVIGTNSYTAVMKNVPDAKFIPFTGLSEQFGDRLATYAIKADKGGGEVAPVAEEAEGEPQQNDTVIDSPEGQATEIGSGADAMEAEETQSDIEIPAPSHCDPIPLKGLQLSMANTIKDIEKLRSTLTDYRQAATKGVYDLEGQILEKKEKMRKQIMNALKWVFDQMIVNAERVANEANKIAQGFATASGNYFASTTYQGLVEAAVCAIVSIIEAFSVYLQDLVDSILDKVINVATCFVENFIAATLAQIDNFITQAINAIFGTIGDLINNVFDVADAGLDTVTDIISFIQDVFSLLSCESDDGCKEYNQTQWNMITGGTDEGSGGRRKSFGEITEKIKDFSEKYNQVYDFTNGITDALENQFSFDLDGIFDIDGCDIGPLLCGPPSVILFGGTGAGFAANPVISESGAIIGVDIVSLGSGYGDGSYAKIVDDCGNGNGGVIIPFRGDSNQDWIDFLNGGDDPSRGGEGLIGEGVRGVTSPYWANIERPDSGGAGGLSITSPVFADGEIFTGVIGPDRLSISDPSAVIGDSLITDTGGGGGDTPNGITTSIYSPVFRNLSLNRDDNEFTGNIGTSRLSIQSITGPGFATTRNIGSGATQSIFEPAGFGTSLVQAKRNALQSIFGPTGFSTNLPVSIGATQSIFAPAGFSTNLPVSIGATGSIFGPTGFSTNLPVSVGGTGSVFDSIGFRTDLVVGVGATGPSILRQGIVGFLIKDTGSRYLRRKDGSLGGMNRTWAKVNETKVQKPDGTYLTPIKPGGIINLLKGDLVELPSGTKVVSEPDANGEGGGEEIIGGKAYTMKGPGVITAPEVSQDTIQGNEPMISDGTYPVITYMLGIYVDLPGTGYEEGDEVVITPSNGAKATLRVTPQGGVLGIKVTKSGEGFREMPRVYIKSKTGIGARLLPQLGVNRVSAKLATEPGVADKIVQVVDVAGGY